MNVTGLLSELRRNILRDVTGAISSNDEDYLWTDEALLNYINESQMRFAFLTEYLQDASTPAVCEITLQEGVTEYPLHSAVIRVLSVRMDDFYLQISQTSYEQGDMQSTVGHTKVPVYSGRGVHAVVLDYEIGVLKIVGTPTADDAGKKLHLRVTRYPLAEFTLDNPEETPEFPVRFHLDLLEWAAFRALRNHDVDAENMAKASAHKTRFMDAVEEVKSELKARKAVQIEYTDSWRW